MRAIVYSRASPDGIAAAELPPPRLSPAPRTPVQLSLARLAARPLWLLCSGVLGAVRRYALWRRGLPTDTPCYGALPDRRYVLCRVHAAGVNPVDAKFLYGDKLPHCFLPWVQKAIEGSVCGIDFSGVVEEAHPGCGFSPGERVFGTVPPLGGTFAETIRVPTDCIALMPSNLSFAEACTVPLVGLTALQAFEDNRLCPGQHLLVIGGSGGTGHVAVQISKARGAAVTALCGGRNVDFVRGLGADAVVAYDDEDFVGRLAAIVRDRGPFDLVFDTVSSHDPRDARFAYETRLRAARPSLLTPQGKYVCLGGLAGDWIRAHLKRFLCVDLFARGHELFWVRFPLSAGQLATLKGYCESGRLRVTLAHTLPFNLEGVREAFRLQMNRRTVGKIALQVVASDNAPATRR